MPENWTESSEKHLAVWHRTTPRGNVRSNIVLLAQD